MEIPKIYTKLVDNKQIFGFTGKQEFAFTYTEARPDFPTHLTFELPSKLMIEDMKNSGVLEDYTKYVASQLFDLLNNTKN